MKISYELKTLKVILHELKTLRANLKIVKGKCKSNRAKIELGEQIKELTKLIESLEREESKNAMHEMW